MVTQGKPREMMEDELFKELLGDNPEHPEPVGHSKPPLIILSTSSPDKREKFRTLFTSLGLGGATGSRIQDRENRKSTGINAFFTDIGQFGDVAERTGERTLTYEGNLDEKAQQQLQLLLNREQELRSMIAPVNSTLDPQAVNIIGMTEDSGWEVILEGEDRSKKDKFIAAVKKHLEPYMRPEDYKDLVESIGKGFKAKDQITDRGEVRTGFPGPDFKPLMEHAVGFNNLMKVLYLAAEEAKIENLRFLNVSRVSFSSPRLKAIFSKTFESRGSILTYAEFKDRVLSLHDTDVVNSDFVHIPDGQAGGKRKTIAEMPDILITSSEKLPAEHARRDVAEWLQSRINNKGIGSRRATKVERDRTIKVGVTSPELRAGKTIGQVEFPHQTDNINDIDYHVAFAYDDALRKGTNNELFADADAVVLMPQKVNRGDQRLYHHPNLSLVLQFVLSAETDPRAMSKPIILDNRKGDFDHVIQVIREQFIQGKMQGDMPFRVAATDLELRRHLMEIKNILQRAPIITPKIAPRKIKRPEELPPDDGIFTVFIGGGHNNNSKAHRADAFNLGYMCAKNHWRIVTGAGTIDGAMGGIHTGFIQYYLDEIAEKYQSVIKLPSPAKNVAAGYLMQGPSGIFDLPWKAEKLLLNYPDFIEALTKTEPPLIPSNMFYGYSLKSLLKLESRSFVREDKIDLDSERKPPGMTYFDTGNLTRRIQYLLQPSTKIFMPGAVGTDQEFVETVKQHLEERKRRLQNGTFKGKSQFKDGTPDGDDGTIIIYNVDGNLNNLLRIYGLAGGGDNDLIVETLRQAYNVIVVDKPEDLREAVTKRAGQWQTAYAEARK